MHFQEIVDQFITGMKATTPLEFIAVFSGIISVWYSRKENILVYPTGLLNTIIYIYLSIKGGLLGEASVNFYYTVMSISGWIMWARKDQQQHTVLHITSSSKKEWVQHLSFFAIFYAVLFFTIRWMSHKEYIIGAIPWADAFASATAYTGMWLMTKKKVESWYWWIATNIASVPLYFVKHYVFTSVYYVVLFIMAVFGLIAWVKKARERNTIDLTAEKGVKGVSQSVS